MHTMYSTCLLNSLGRVTAAALASPAAASAAFLTTAPLAGAATAAALASTALAAAALTATYTSARPRYIPAATTAVFSLSAAEVATAVAHPDSADNAVSVAVSVAAAAALLLIILLLKATNESPCSLQLSLRHLLNSPTAKLPVDCLQLEY
jgi:hypothetical protein